jgi:hypothetical protein
MKTPIHGMGKTLMLERPRRSIVQYILQRERCIYTALYLDATVKVVLLISAVNWIQTIFSYLCRSVDLLANIRSWASVVLI